MWNSCDNWTINQPALPTCSGLKPSCCSKCECNVILVWLFSFVLIFSKLSTRNYVLWARPLNRWGGGGRGCHYPGCTQTITPSPLALAMGMLFWTLHECVINRKTWYNLLKLYFKNTRQICFLLFSFSS